LSAQAAGIFPPANPTFDLYNLWSAEKRARRQSIYRGMTIFNTRTFTIKNVAGLNNIPVLTNPLTRPLSLQLCWSD
jgi:hypothetical protein